MTFLFIFLLITLFVIIIFTTACVFAMIQVHREQKKILQDRKDKGELTGDQMLEQ